MIWKISAILLLSACITVPPIARVPEHLQDDAEMLLTSDGDFWGLGSKGTFDLAGQYSGKFDREAHNASWADNLFEVKESSMLAEVVNNNSGSKWILNCSGKVTNVNSGMITFTDEENYTCDILQSGRRLGTFVLKRFQDSSGFAPSGKVDGEITLNSLIFTIESVHDFVGGLLPTEYPIGYSVRNNGKVIGIIQTNGRISLRADDQLSEDEMDLLVISTVASALSWRVKE